MRISWQGAPEKDADVQIRNCMKNFSRKMYEWMQRMRIESIYYGDYLYTYLNREKEGVAWRT